MPFFSHLPAHSFLHRLSRLLLGPALVVIILPLSRAAHAQQPPLPGSGGCSPQERVITVWKVGTPYRNTLPGKSISADLNLKAKSLGCSVEVKVFPAVGFADWFYAAFQKHKEPDILVAEYGGAIWGTIIRSGKYTKVFTGETVRRTPVATVGIASNEAVDRALENVEDSLAGLDDVRSLKFLLRTSRNHSAARLLAVRPPECGVRRDVPPLPANLRNLIGPVAQAYLGGTPTIKRFEDPERLDTVISDPWPYQVSETKVCGYWGKSRLAFVQTSSSYQGVDSLGWVTTLLIFRKQKDRWGLLTASVDLTTNHEFVKEIPKVVARIRKASAQTVAPRPAELLAPREGKSPAGGKRIRALRWRPSPSRDVVEEIAEFARNGDARLFVRPMSRDRLQAEQISAEKLPEVHGEWRWRVWSISDSGTVAFSSSKSFTY